MMNALSLCDEIEIKSDFRTKEVQLMLERLRKNEDLSNTELELGLQNEDPGIRVLLARKCKTRISQAQFERGLCDTSPSVQIEFLLLHQFRLPSRLIPKIIENGSEPVILHLLDRQDALQFEATTTESLLTHESWVIRRAMAWRFDFTPTAPQIERGLIDAEPSIVNIFQHFLENNPLWRSILEEHQLRKQFEATSAKRRAL
jgi:hypothetical protein